MPDNPRAFPGGLAEGMEPDVKMPYNGGMTLRDYFAAAALTGILAVASSDRQAAIAAECYDLADAMLAERQKG